jgi:hypothetical protein
LAPFDFSLFQQYPPKGDVAPATWSYQLKDQ